MEKIDVIESIDDRNTHDFYTLENEKNDFSSLSANSGETPRLFSTQTSSSDFRRTQPASGQFMEPELSTSASRKVARQIALQTSQKEIDELHARHRSLVTKRFTEGLLRKEELELQLIRWNIDRIEDAQMGHKLDELEHMAEIQQNFADKLLNLANRWTPRSLTAHKKRGQR